MDNNSFHMANISDQLVFCTRKNEFIEHFKCAQTDELKSLIVSSENTEVNNNIRFSWPSFLPTFLDSLKSRNIEFYCIQVKD